MSSRDDTPSRAPEWGLVIKKCDGVEFHAVWECARKIWDAVTDIKEHEDLELGFAQAILARESGIALAKIKARYETINSLREWGFTDILGEPNSYYENVQAVVRTTNKDLSPGDRKKIIRRMDREDKGARVRTSYALAKHYCKEEKRVDPREKGDGVTPVDRPDLDTPGRIADALQAILDNSKTAPATVRRMPEYKGLRGFIKKLRHLGDTAS